MKNGNTYVTLAGCQLLNNYASFGGGYYLSKYNDHYAVLTSDVYLDTMLVQTSHPYTSIAPINNIPQVIFNETVTIEHADELMIIFDAQSSMSSDDSLSIWTNSSQVELLYETRGGGAAWPGQGVPPLRYQLSSVFIIIYGPSQNYVDEYEYYGVKLTVYPSGTYYIEKSDSIVNHNNADETGGGGMISFLNNNNVVIATQFDSNTAHDGGAMYVQSVNAGPYITGSIFERNHAVSGGALVLSTSNYGTGLWNSIISHNMADQKGGGVFIDASNGQGLFVIGNHVNVTNCVFFNNSAIQGVYAVLHTYVHIYIYIYIYI